MQLTNNKKLLFLLIIANFITRFFTSLHLLFRPLPLNNTIDTNESIIYLQQHHGINIILCIDPKIGNRGKKPQIPHPTLLKHLEKHIKKAKNSSNYLKILNKKIINNPHKINLNE